MADTDLHPHRSNTDLERPILASQDRTDGEAVKLRRHERVAILAGGLVAAIERVIRSAQNVAASAATFARNDLLFTMSDNARDAIPPVDGWESRFANLH